MGRSAGKDLLFEADIRLHWMHYMEGLVVCGGVRFVSHVRFSLPDRMQTEKFSVAHLL